jgi:hypothetical protein
VTASKHRAPTLVSSQPAPCNAAVTPALVIPIDPTPALPILPDPGDVAIGVALAKTAPTNLIPNDPAPVAPTPANPVPSDVTIDPVRTALASIVPADPVPVDPTLFQLSTRPQSFAVPRSHGQLVLPVASALIGSAFRTRVLVRDIASALFCHVFFMVSFSWSRRKLEGDSAIANEGVRMFEGGTCDSELCSLHWCQGSC